MKRSAALIALFALLLALALLPRRYHSSPPAISSTPPSVSSSPHHTRPDPMLVRSVPQHLATLSWGTGPAQLGHRQDPEAAVDGPMALRWGSDGSVYVLDTVNTRILRRGPDGNFKTPLHVDALVAQDLVIARDGSFTVLERFGEHKLRHYAPNGTLIDEHTLASIGVEDPGGTTGLYQSQDDIYVEESLQGQGRRVLRPLSGGPTLPGRPMRDGSGLIAGALLDAAHGRFAVRGLFADGGVRWETLFNANRRVLSIALLDSDERGEVYVGVVVASLSGLELRDETLLLYRLDAAGTQRASVALPHPPSALETFRELCVGKPGVVLWMHPASDDNGMIIDEILL